MAFVFAFVLFCFFFLTCVSSTWGG